MRTCVQRKAKQNSFSKKAPQCSVHLVSMLPRHPMRGIFDFVKAKIEHVRLNPGQQNRQFAAPSLSRFARLAVTSFRSAARLAFYLLA